MKAHIDFETYSEANLKKVGAVKYAQHPSTRIISMSWAIGDSPVCTWAPGLKLGTWAPELKFPIELERHIVAGGLLEAHGALFERSIWEWVARVLYNWPAVPEASWRCSMAVCGYRAVPLKLEKVAKALNLSHQKDMAGNRVMLQMSKPDRKGRQPDDFTKLQQTYDYCVDDVEVERELSGVIGELPAQELAVWKLDQVINLRGVRVDLNFVASALEIIDQVGEQYHGRLSQLTGGHVQKVSQVARIVEWCHDQGIWIPNLQEEVVKEWLVGIGDVGHQDVREVLEARQVLGGAAPKKYLAAQRYACEDGRARGMLQYHAATTGRWAGRGPQPHNMLKSNYHDEPELLVQAINQRDAGFLDMIHPGGAMKALADAVKLMFTCSRGRVMAAGDFNTVEFRILMVLAGQDDMIGKLRKGEDPYLDFGKDLYGRTITKEGDPGLRQISKHCVLGLGFQMGAPKLIEQVWKNSGGEIVIDEELSERAVHIYRVVKYPQVPKFWRAMNAASIRAVLTGSPVACGPLEYEMRGDWLTLRLESGKRLYFREPRVKTMECPWSTDEDPAYQETLLFKAYKYGQWRTVKSYGGLQVASAVQATARELMVHAMFTAEREAYPLVLTVHDELVTEPEISRHPSAVELEDMMTDLPLWAKGYPIAAEAWVGERFR